MQRPGFSDRIKPGDWANTCQSQSGFLGLIRRIIPEAAAGFVDLGVPADKGVADGRLRVRAMIGARPSRVPKAVYSNRARPQDVPLAGGSDRCG